MYSAKNLTLFDVIIRKMLQFMLLCQLSRRDSVACFCSDLQPFIICFECIRWFRVLLVLLMFSTVLLRCVLYQWPRLVRISKV